MKKRIIGIDVARALAVIGMIIVNFKVAFGSTGNEWLKEIAGFFDGKAAATFVVLAGVGIALMSNSAIKNQNTIALKTTRERIVKRAIILFAVGLSYIVIWPADILHFYGIYMLITLLLLKSKEKTILISALVMIFVYPALMMIFSYDAGWDFTSLEYQGFWTFTGFFRNLLYNGFHPVIPWSAFMLIGLWFGRKDLNNIQFVKKSLWVSLSIFLAIQIISYVIIELLSEGILETRNELKEIMGASPMPPLPVYMISGSSIAIFIISSCILIGNKFSSSRIMDALNKTGQLALTFYVAHVVIGMGIVEAINPGKIGNYSIYFSMIYALLFSALCVAFAVIWRKYKNSGPLESLMRKIAD